MSNLIEQCVTVKNRGVKLGEGRGGWVELKGRWGEFREKKNANTNTLISRPNLARMESLV